MTTGWIQTAKNCWVNPAGYRISASRLREAALRYCAWAPPCPVEEFEAKTKVRYARGQRVPQVRELLGCHDSAEAARAACAEHAAKMAA